MKNYYRFTLTVAAMAIFTGFLVAPVAAQREKYAIREGRAPAIVKQRLELTRRRIQARNLTFKVGYTYALERGVENLTMKTPPPKIAVAQSQKHNRLALELINIDALARFGAGPKFKINNNCFANSKTYDYRTEGKVTAIKQQKCGNCWAYATAAAYESSYLIQNNQTVDASEQFIVTNSKAGDCTGGYPNVASEFLVNTGTATETSAPDSGTNGTPNADTPTPYDAVAWGWANPDDPGTSSVAQIKKAMCEHGPVITWIDAGGTFGGYTGGDSAALDVYNDDDDKEPGYTGAWHAVAIIGWDDNRGAWLIKNSWSENWGFNAGVGTEGGYGWVKYGVHQIGTNVSWIKAKSVGYRLPITYYQLLPKKKLIVVNPLIIKPNIPQ